MCHTDLQQDISRASFSHQIERVLFRASFLVRVFGASLSYAFLVRLSWALVDLGASRWWLHLKIANLPKTVTYLRIDQAVS